MLLTKPLSLHIPPHTFFQPLSPPHLVSLSYVFLPVCVCLSLSVFLYCVCVGGGG
jgi:hypothetical protein